MALIAGAAYLLGSSGSGSSDSTASAANVATTCDASSVADHVLPSVVMISANGATGGGTGSGEVIRSDGYILTNNHVIAEAANGGHVEVTFSDGATAPATITGRDPQTDLAVLHVTPPSGIKVIAIGKSDTVRVGQPVVALGAPLGLGGTVTAGIVSALNRNVHVPAENGQQALLVSAVQTDAAINPGNSGGALVNCGDQLIGVPTAGATVSGEGGSIGLGFAIPVDSAMQIANELIKNGSVTHSFFGLVTVPVPGSTSSQAGPPEGLFVQGVEPGGPAATAGLRTGDVITEIDGHAATSNIQLESLTLTKRPGDTVAVTYIRDGQKANATITLGASPT
ncbi:MAG: S1C family serine protease [Gaiellales bacterium]